MEKIDGKSTVKAKHTFEHCHSNNRIFVNTIFKDAESTVERTLSFCRVNAHNQNVQTENLINNVTTRAHTSILHTSHRWQEAIHTALWPDALKNYTNVRNYLPIEFKPE